MSSEKIGRYEVKEELGRGGMATVFRAFDPRFRREVALKILPRHYLHDPTFRARFEREAQTIATLEHPAIVPVYDFGHEEDQPFLVMRLMRGGSLVEYIRRGPLSLQQAAEILNRLAPALDNAHDHAIIHRDLKPQNILFDRWGKPYLADFGIVKLVEESVTNLTASGGAVGTPAYMSPEQVTGVDELDGRSDIYSLGVILFEMITGKLPYNARTPMSLALKHITEPVPKLAESNQSLPAGGQELIDRAMAKDREQRYATAAVLASAVSELSARTPEVPSAAIPVVSSPITPESPLKSDDDAEEPLPAEDVKVAALAAASILSQVSPDTPTELDQPSVEQPAEKDSRAVIMPPFAANTPTELDHVSGDPLLEAESDELGAAVAASSADDTETILEKVSEELAEEAIIATAALATVDAPASGLPGSAAAPDAGSIARMPAFLTSGWRYLALIPLLLLIGIGGYYALSAGFAGRANVSNPPPLSTQQSTTDEFEVVPLPADEVSVTPSRKPLETATATSSGTPSRTSTRTPRLTRTPAATRTAASTATARPPTATATLIVATNTNIPPPPTLEPTSPPQPTDPPSQPTNPPQPQPTDPPPPQPTDPPPPQPTDPPPPQPTDPPPPEPTDPPSPPTRGPTPEPP